MKQITHHAIVLQLQILVRNVSIPLTIFVILEQSDVVVAVMLTQAGICPTWLIVRVRLLK